MIGRAQHLQDDTLFECYLAELEAAAVDPLIAAHLNGCTTCAARLRELTEFMGSLRAEADADIDAIFTPERLRHQQQQITHRIEHLGHAARVISFPVRLVSRHMARTASRVAPRWAAAAAVAGLVVGVGVGTLIDPARRTVPAEPETPPVIAAVAPVLTVTEPPPATDDEAFLSELEMALSGPRNEELLPFDALTPRVQPISSQFR